MPKLQKQVSDIGLASSKGISLKDPTNKMLSRDTYANPNGN